MSLVRGVAIDVALGREKLGQLEDLVDFAAALDAFLAAEKYWIRRPAKKLAPVQ